MNKNIYTGSRILLVEDEDSLAIGLEYNLSEEGYIVERAADGEEALEYIKKDEYDLIILDLMLPYLDGFELAKLIRLRFPKVPILILTAKTGIKDRIKGLELGADDYLTKPFHLEELLLRLKGMLRRKMWYKSATDSKPIYRFGENEINFLDLTCQVGKDKIRLTVLEAMVLKYLLEHKDKIVTRKELLEKVWNIHSEVETRTIDNFIARLRKYFEPNPAKPIYILSIRSAGYMFKE